MQTERFIILYQHGPFGCEKGMIVRATDEQDAERVFRELSGGAYKGVFISDIGKETEMRKKRNFKRV